MRTILGVLALVGAMLVPAAPANAAGCTPSERGMPARSSAQWWRKADVWMYGDSITYQTYRNLRAHSSARIGVDAWWGRTTDRAVAVLGNDVHRFPKRLPKVVVMAQGTNDLDDLPSLAREVRLARAVLPARVKLVWVNLYVDTTDAYNAADRIISSVPGVRVVSWSRANLSRMNADGTSSLLLDGIHVNGAGCEIRNKMISHAIRKAL